MNQAAVSGLATAEGTARYAQRLACAPGHFRSSPPGASPGLQLSSLGMGTYTGPATDEGDRQYAESTREAVRRGINVIDCAINYRHMRSERAVGSGLRALFDSGEASRDEVFLMTKGGYIPFEGAAPRDILDYLRRTYLNPGLIQPNEIVAGSHCIAPKFLENQLQRSLRNLGLTAVDAYFLHGVEQQLEEVSREEFERRVLAAFRFLEEAVGRGLVGFYGVASWNGFRVLPGAKGHLSLERLAALAQEAGGDAHHFRVVQLPYNLGMPEALTVQTQELAGKRAPLLEAASAFGMMVVTSVPLLQTQLLAHVPPVFADKMPGLATPAQRAIQFVRSTPGVLAPLAGMRSAEHVRENAVLAGVPPLSQEEFFRLISG